jgi:glycosyltransferase involved in cell wall biosynthesis
MTVMNKKVILLIANAASVHTQRTARNLREGGWEVHIASFEHSEIAGVLVHHIPTLGLGKIGYFLGIWVLRRLKRRIKPTMFHAHHITSNGYISAIAGVRPLVITAWGSDILVTPHDSMLKRSFVQHALKGADAIVVEAEHVREKALALGAVSSRTHVVSFGVNLSAFRFRRARGEAADFVRIISTRNHLPVYDVSTFIKALSIFAMNFSEFEATIAGDGPMRSELEDLTKKLGLDDRVAFVGRVTEEHLGALLAESDIFVTTSLSDGENISLNEAMACGCFPIASAIPANSVIEDGANGLLFAPSVPESLSEALMRAIRIRATWPTIVANNRMKIEMSSNSKDWLGRMEAIYCEAGKREH